MASFALAARIRRQACLVVCVLGGALALSAPPAVAADAAAEFGAPPLVERPQPRELRELLATVDDDLPLRVRLASREVVEGHPWRVYGDTLLLVPPAEFLRLGLAPTPRVLVRAPVAEIVQVQQRRSGLQGGAGWGAKSGVIVGGGLGVLIGVAVAALAEDDDAVVGPVLALGLVGVASGAIVGSGIGAGVGALTHDWYTLWPVAADGEVAPGDADGGPRRTRVCAEAGWSSSVDADIDGRGLGARLGIMRRLGQWAEMGPCLEYHGIEGLADYESYYGGTGQRLTERVFALGLDVRANGGALGARPFASFGLGWFLGDGLYLGVHGGGGVRWRDGGGREYSLALRRYAPLTDTDGDEGHFWSLGAGFTFGE